MQITHILENKPKPPHKPQYFLVLDQYPLFLYEEQKAKSHEILMAQDDGFYSCYVKEFDKFQKAFCGREFTIPMLDGTEINANGQWWYGGHGVIPEPYHSMGIATPEQLKDCFVFTSGCVSQELFKEAFERLGGYTDYRTYQENPGGTDK